VAVQSFTRLTEAARRRQVASAFVWEFPLGGGLLGAAIGAATGGNNANCSFFCPSPSLLGAAVGILVGMAVAPIVDISVLAFDDPPARPHANAAPLHLQFAPIAAVPRDSAGHVAPTFGLVGSF
jgi:hypothetical protein